MIKRYTPVDQWGQEMHKCMAPDESGSYVRASDYDALAAQEQKHQTPENTADQPSADALDAARYRWLRQMIYDDRIIVAADRMLHGDALDAAIDAARAATPPAQPSAVQRPYVAYNDRGEPCENGLLPDGPRCPRCGGPRGVSGVDGGSWVHYPSKRPTDKPGAAL